MSTDRDRSLEMLLCQRPQDEAASVAQCVDAEVLAAWMDGALSDQTLAQVEKHAGGCTRCQALLASMAKATPAVEPRPWWRAVSAKWLVPIAAVATALLVWVSVGSRRERLTTPPAQSAATTVPTAPEPTTPPEPASPPTGQSAHSLADSVKERPIELKKDAVIEQEARRKSATAAGNTAEAPPRLDALDKTADAVSARPRAGIAGGVAGGVASAPYSVPPPAAPAQPAPASPPPQQAAGGPSQSRAAAAETSVAETVKITPDMTAKQLAADRGSSTVAFGGTLEIRSPQSDYRWRIVPPSGIQRSVDGGATWSIVDSVPVQVAAGAVPAMVLTTGSSPSRDVCWIVGRAGVVLVTTDGATWQRRAVPGSPDLIGVRAADGRSATVTTADGHQYSTSDGGVTWTLVK